MATKGPDFNPDNKLFSYFGKITNKIKKKISFECFKNYILKRSGKRKAKMFLIFISDEMNVAFFFFWAVIVQ